MTFIDLYTLFKNYQTNVYGKNSNYTIKVSHVINNYILSKKLLLRFKKS